MKNETEQKIYNLKNDERNESEEITRKNIRLQEYDYAQNGYYFITICTKNRKCILSEIENREKHRGEHCSSAYSNKLTLIGEIVEKYIKEMEIIYENIEIDEYIIMPNHMHIILIIKKTKSNNITNDTTIKRNNQ